jgi:acyl-CoA synthetase (AMP-forming)/AMP-acid ligase II
VRGPGSSRSYFKGEGGNPLVDGWFPTGDVATIDADGFMQITDRSKDVIKSGGEWISSIDSRTSPWRTRRWPWPPASACRTPSGTSAHAGGGEEARRRGHARGLLAFYDGKVAKWQVPDDVVFVDAIPLGATGKMQKTKLREQLKDYKLPTA